MEDAIIEDESFTDFTNLSSYENKSLEDLLLELLAKTDPNEDQAFLGRSTLIFLYIVSGVLAVFGNSIVVILLIQSLGRRSRIDLYQLNLAIADLLTSVFCVPFTFAQAHMGYWPAGNVICTTVLFLQLLFISVSAYTNVAIGIDRFFGVMFPLKWKATFNKRKILIFMVWSVSSAIAIPEIVVARSLPQDMGNYTEYLCNEYWQNEDQKRTFTLVVFLLVLVLPLFVLAITYSCVVYSLWVRQTPGNADIRRDRNRLASRKQVTRMLIVIVAMFALCWLPLHIFNVLVDFYHHIFLSVSEQVLQAVFFFCHWVAMSHAFINPIIYVVADKDFKSKVKLLFTCRHVVCLHRSPNENRDLHVGEWTPGMSWRSFHSRRNKNFSSSEKKSQNSSHKMVAKSHSDPLFGRFKHITKHRHR